MRGLCILISMLALSAFSGETDVQALAKAAVQAVGGLEKIPQHFAWKEEYFLGVSEKPHPRTAILHPPTQWFQNGKDIAEGNRDRTEKTYLASVWTLRPLLDPESKLTPLPDVDVDGKPTAGLKLSREKQLGIKLYFFKDTHALARIDWRTFQIYFAAPAELDGFKYPTQAFVKHADGKPHLRTVFKEFIRIDEKAAVWPKK